MSTEQPPRWSCWSWHRAAIGGTAATDPVSLDAGMRAACVGDEDGDGDGDGGEKPRGLRNTGRGENAEDLLMMEKEERETRRRSSRERERQQK